MEKLSIRDMDVKGKRTLVRVDFNVPLDEKRNIADDTRIRAALPTILDLKERGARVILVSHLGRPKGEVNEKYSLAPVAKRLSELIGEQVILAETSIGPKVESMINEMAQGQVLLLENIRFYAGEEKNDPGLSSALAQLADIYVNDAFGTAHRAHSSTVGVAELVPAVAGFLMEKEINIIGKALANPDRPFVAIIGGAKVSDKIGVIKNLLAKVDSLIIGGGMANTFLKAQGYNLGKSLVEEDKVELAKELLVQAKEKGVSLLLPEDLVVASEFSAQAENQVVGVDSIPDTWMALDIGPTTRAKFAQAVREARTVIWNGPMGVFEMEAFAKGTEAVAVAMAETEAITIIGGGDSVAAVEKVGVANQMTHISTGGGASLEFMEGKILPGVAALKDRQ